MPCLHHKIWNKATSALNWAVCCKAKWVYMGSQRCLGWVLFMFRVYLSLHIIILIASSIRAKTPVILWLSDGCLRFKGNMLEHIVEEKKKETGSKYASLKGCQSIFSCLRMPSAVTWAGWVGKGCSSKHCIRDSFERCRLIKQHLWDCRISKQIGPLTADCLLIS